MLPEKMKEIYSINDGNYVTWDEPMQRAVDGFKFNKVDGKYKPYTARYVGSMVADVHRTLLYGGIYLYPADKEKGNGKQTEMKKNNFWNVLFLFFPYIS